MKRVKIISVMLLMSLFCGLFSGCVGNVSKIKINSDGSGRIEIFSGVEETVFNALLELEGTKEAPMYTSIEQRSYNGNVYIGETIQYSFSNINELNEFFHEDTEDIIIMNSFTVFENIDGSYTLKIQNLGSMNGVEESAEKELLAAISEMDVDVSDEDIDFLLNSLVAVIEFTFPSNVKQIQGTNAGIKIDKNCLTLDIFEMSKVAQEKSNIVFEFTNSETATHVITFTDVPNNVWYYNAVMALAEGGLVSGIGDNKFNPNGTLTYAQFCQILARAKGYATGSENNYWAYKAVKSCVESGLILSRGEVISANYDVAIPREAAIAAMYLAKKDELVNPAHNFTSNNIPDFNSISDCYKENILSAYNYSITTGVSTDYTFSPHSNLTRGQVCQLFYNLNWTKAA